MAVTRQRHPNEPGAEDVPPPAQQESGRREYDPSMRPVWTHGRDGKPNRKIWIQKTLFGGPGEHLNPPPDRSMQERRYAAQNEMLLRLARASTAGLERAAAIMSALSDEDLDRVFRYAEGLVEWAGYAVTSSDAPGSSK